MSTLNCIYPGQSVVVVGFGQASRAMARYLAGRGLRVAVSETRHKADFSEVELQQLDQYTIDFEGGGHTAAFLGRGDCVLLSPGVNPLHPAISAVRQGGMPIIGELAIAAPVLRIPVIAITGTNGKTTVTELVGAMLQQAGRSVFVGGNIGTPVAECLSSNHRYEIAVLEISSFQLEFSGEFIPQVGVLLNITPDHLDRHGSMAAYAAAKMRIFQGGPERTTAVVNGDDLFLCTALPTAYAGAVRRFGRAADTAARIDGSRIVISTGVRDEVFDLAGTALNTVTGRMNAAAALLAVSGFGLAADSLDATLKSFHIGAHRLQHVAEIDGVRYINDSKATNTGAVNSALAQVSGRVILIAGGKDKGDDYRLLREAVARSVIKLVLIGEAAPALEAALGDLVPVCRAASMAAAVRESAGGAHPGDTVLLSPACASFDMFNNYQHRGNCFAESVQQLQQDAAGAAAP